MKIELNPAALVSDAIAKVLPAEKLEQIARQEIRKELGCVPTSRAARFLGIKPETLLRSDVPYINMGSRERTYAISDLIEARNKRRVKP